MTQIPAELKTVLDDFSAITDRSERTEYLIELADRFNEVKVPASIATKPYPEDHRVPHCESDAYIWADDQPDGSVKFYFDVLNPQGLSAMAISVILDETLSGKPLEQVAAVTPEIVLTIFGQSVSMGKGQGLMGIVGMAQREALLRLGREK
ncbi:MAG: SufE family protein [Phototrophicaceae bacterium]